MVFLFFQTYSFLNFEKYLQLPYLFLKSFNHMKNPYHNLQLYKNWLENFYSMYGISNIFNAFFYR